MIHKMKDKAKPNRSRRKAFVISLSDRTLCHTRLAVSVTNLTSLIWHQLQCSSWTHRQDEGSGGWGVGETDGQLTSGARKDETVAMMDGSCLKSDRWTLQLGHLTFNSHSKEKQRMGSRDEIKFQKTRTHRKDTWSNEEGKMEISILVHKS